jgi:replicative DNA helicase
MLPEPKDDMDRVERGILGLIWTHSWLAEPFFARIDDPQVFGLASLQKLFVAERVLYQRGDEISYDTVRAELNKTMKRGVTMLLKECKDLVEPELRDNFHGHIERLNGAYLLREFKRQADKTLIPEDVPKAIDRILQLQSHAPQKSQARIDEVIPRLQKRQRDIEEGRDKEGPSWGIEPLDDRVPIRDGVLIGVAALKGGGKSLFGLHVVHHNLLNGIPAIVFSLEMTQDQLTKRILTKQAGINSRLFPSKHLGRGKKQLIDRSIEVCSKLPLTIDEAILTAPEIAARIRAWKCRNNIETGAVLVDFLQLVDIQQERGMTRAEALGRAAYTLCHAAKKSNLPIITTCQLRNEAENRVPDISLIEGSGTIAAACDAVLILDLVSRRDRRKKSEDQWQDFNVLIEKNRDGESQIRVDCIADLSTGTFRPKSDRYTEEHGKLWV